MIPSKRLAALALVLWSSLASRLYARPAALATTISDLRYEPSEHALYLPFDGPRPPIATVAYRGQSVVIDVPRAGFPYSELFAKVEHSSLLRAYVGAYDPEIKGLHLVIEGRVALQAEPDAGYRGHGMRFVFAARDPEGSLPPESATDVVQHVTAVPSDGGGERAYTVGTLTKRWTFPALQLGYSMGPVSEQYAPQSIAARANSASQFDASWDPTYGEYSMPVRLGRGAYSLNDPDYAGVTHERTETRLEGAFSRSYPLGNVAASTGVGYLADLTQVQTNASVVAPTLFFAGYQLMHGPLLRQTLGGTLWGPLGAQLDVGWSPFVFANMSDGTAMAYLTTVRAEPRLYLWPDQRVSLGYFYERTLGPDFNRESSGLTLGISFAGF